METRKNIVEICDKISRVSNLITKEIEARPPAEETREKLQPLMRRVFDALTEMERFNIKSLPAGPAAEKDEKTEDEEKKTLKSAEAAANDILAFQAEIYGLLC